MDQEVFGTQFRGQDDVRDVLGHSEKFRRSSSRIFQPFKKIFKTRKTRESNISTFSENIFWKYQITVWFPIENGPTHPKKSVIRGFFFYRESYGNHHHRKSRFLSVPEIVDMFDSRVLRVLNIFLNGFVILLEHLRNFSECRRTSRTSSWPRNCVPNNAAHTGYLEIQHKPPA